jgi:hypothetical protein
VKVKFPVFTTSLLNEDDESVASWKNSSHCMGIRRPHRFPDVVAKYWHTPAGNRSETALLSSAAAVIGCLLVDGNTM